MKNLLRILCCLALSINTTILSGFSQVPVFVDLMKVDIQSKIPPLAVLIDTAISIDPYVKFRNKQITVNKFKLSLERNYWMRDIGFQADIRYGNFDNWSTNTSEGQTPSSFGTVRTETKYGMGAYIKFPMFDLLNQRTKNNLARKEIEQAEDMYQMQQNELRVAVIRQYNDMVMKQKILRIKSKYLETARINMLMTEKEFINGVIPVAEYSRISEIVSKAEENYETAKMEFRTAYMILEEIVGIKFNLSFDNPLPDENQ